MSIADIIKQALQYGESQTLEFKSSFDRDAIETLVAFANTQGCTVLVEVADDCSVKGITIGKESLNEWLAQIKLSTSPAIIPDIEAIKVNGKTVVAIRVGEYPVKPINTKGKYFRRIASYNHQLTLSEITDMYTQSLQLSWDAYEAPKESLDTLSLVKIETFIEKVNQSGRFMLDNSPHHALEKLKFIVNNHPTWGAMLLFAETPLRHHIHIGRFKTPTMIIDDQQITDTLFEAVEQAMKFIVSHISVAFAFDGSLQRNERFFYPLPVLREVLLNAVVHRDYSNSFDIQIKIFDDHITFFSPGMLYGGLTIEDLKTDTYQSRTRNKLIAEAFYLTNNIEKYGSGYIRIRKELETYPELYFNVEEIGGGVLVTFKGIEGINKGINGLYDYIKEHPGLKIPEFSRLLNTPAKTLERWLRLLKDDNRVLHTGSRKAGGYRIVDGERGGKV